MNTINKQQLNNDTRKISNNIPINYVYNFLLNFDATEAIWVLYLAYKGMSLVQIGLIEGIFHITSFICEVPSGALADLLGRKRTIVIGRMLCCFSSFLMIFSTTFEGFAFSFVIIALGYNFNSGSVEALVFDSLKQLDREKEYLKINSRINFIIEIARALGVFIGGIMAEKSFLYCYGMSATLSIFRLLLACCFRDTDIQLQTKKEKSMGIVEHFKVCRHIMKDSREVRNILLYYPLMEAFYMVVFFYGQQFLAIKGLNKIEIAACMLIAGFSSALGAGSAKLFMKLTKGKIRYLASLIMSITIFAYTLGNIQTVIASFCVMSFFSAMLGPISSDALNEKIPSAQRATIISVSSMLYSFMMILLFPTTGALADYIGLGKTFLGIALLLLLTLSIIYFYKRYKNLCNTIGK